MKVIFSQGFYVAMQFHMYIHVYFYSERRCKIAMEFNDCIFNNEGGMNLIKFLTKHFS